jgi:16S rRNA (guanine(966)-N(2))-methyltransferase RsmD
MRVISGTARGRRLIAPPGQATRPILDQQKQSLFNILQDRFPNAGVLDLFAGSGSLAIEALSRGAERATLVETRPQALSAIRENLRACRFEDRARVIARDALLLDPARLEHALGLIFLDPPFPLYVAAPERLHDLAARVMTLAALEDDAVLVLRVPREATVPAFARVLAEWQRRPFGESLILFLTRAPPA